MNARRNHILFRAGSVLLLLFMLAYSPGALAAPGDTTRVSVDSGGVQANAASGGRPSISGSGRYVAFVSDASNLVAGDTNGFGDVFVYDRQTGVTTRESVATGGGQAGGGDVPVISADGRYVAFVSGGSDFGVTDTNGIDDIYVHDRQSGTTERVSMASDGTEANDLSDWPAISGDGRYVAFSSSASNLVTTDTNGQEDVFLHDRVAHTTVRVSVDSSGAESNGTSGVPVISADGSRVAFFSGATNLVASDTNSHGDVFVHDTGSGVTSLASVASDGTQANGNSLDPAISDDGRYVAFTSGSTNLGIPDTLAYDYIYVHDMQTGATTPVWQDSEGFQLVGDSFAPVLSADGRFVAFNFDDGGDGLPFTTILLQDRQTGATSTVPVTISGNPPSESTFLPSISDDGQFIAYRSAANNLVADDTNGVEDVFVTESADEPGAPSVSSVTPVDPNPTNVATVSYTVTFSEIVFGVNAADFSLATTGSIVGASITDVTGSGATRTIAINTGNGDGTIRLDVVDDDSIHDTASLPLGGAGAGNGGFTTATAYTVDKGVAAVTAILRADPSPTAAASVHFTVNFSESVSGVDAGDFVLAVSGLTGASVADVTGSGASYTVTVDTGTGNGTLRLDLSDNDSIIDSNSVPLGGAGAGNGNFNAGESYLVEKTPPTPTPKPPVIETLRLRSNGLNDGWVLESAEDSNQGGSIKSTGTELRIGDDGSDRQYRTVMHFPTSGLPDNAVITMAILVFKQQGIVGTDPFTTHQNIAIDIRNGSFGVIGPFPFSGLQTSDFEAPANLSPAGVVLNNPVGGWYWATLDVNALQFINTTGVTQFRLAFQLDDNDDLGPDYLSIMSGDASLINDRPHLVIQYYVP